METRFPPRRILVPTDFSPPARRALHAAKVLGRLFRANLDLVYVLRPEYPGAEVEPLGLPISPLVEIPWQAMADRRSKLLSDGRGYPASRLRALVIPGWPVETLARLAVPKQADLIVMGTHGYEGLNRVFHGSTAEALVRRSRVPVLTLHDRHSAFELKRVLCAVNLTAFSATALAYAAKLARAAGASLSVLHVAEKGWEDDRRRELETFLRAALGRRARHAELLISRGDPGAEIERHARGRESDLVVLAEHLHPWSSERFFGSTAEKVLRHATAPVLSIPAPAVRPPLQAPPWLSLRPRAVP